MTNASMWTWVAAIAALALFGAGCGGDDDDSSDSTGFSGGSFTVTVTSVQDGCFDGAMNTVVLPEGTPRDLPAPVNVPAWSDLPGQIDIAFNPPFQNVTGVPIEADGDNGIKTTGAGFAQVDVDIGSDGKPCLTNMMVTASLLASGDDKFTGTAVLTITAAEGDDCPAFQSSPPCAVTTPLEANRAD